MLYKIKIQFMPKDYQLNLIRQLQNLRHKVMTVKEYTEELFKLIIRARQTQEDIERVAKYINGLRFEIEDDISFLNLKIVEDAYQSSLRVEENLLRRHNQKNRGRGSAKGSPNIGGKFHTSMDGAEGSSSCTP